MNNRSFFILMSIVLVMFGLLYLQPPDFERRPQQLVLPGLSEVLNDVDRITITGAGNAPVATLTRGDRYWALAERDGYRADVGRIRRNLIALGDARVVEVKTSDPSLHSRLGVEDLEQADARGKRLVIEAPAETFDLIVGDTGVRGDMAYVRRPAANQSFLVSAKLDLGDDTVDWLQRDLMDIDAGRVHTVTLTHADGETLRIERPSRNADELSVVDMPGGRQLQYETILDSTAGLLSGLDFDDVARADDTPEDTAAVVARFETFDGLIVEATLTEFGGGETVRFAAAADADLAARFAAPDTDVAAAGQLSLAAVEDEANKLNDRVAGWAYKLPSFKADQLRRRLEDLLQPQD